MPGTTFVVLGASGAGKSTLLNRLAGADVQRTQSIREADGRGRHTTTAGELVVLPSGAILIDTPGVKALGLWDAGEGMAQVFADIEELAPSCRFADCEHRTEPGCAVRDVVGRGPANSWRKLRRELARTSGERTAQRQGRGAPPLEDHPQGQPRPTAPAPEHPTLIRVVTYDRDARHIGGDAAAGQGQVRGTTSAATSSRWSRSCRSSTCR